MPKQFTLIVCTYMRSQPLLTLLESVRSQSLYPTEILIIDGSTDTKTETVLSENKFDNLNYFKVDAANRGLTKQRNFGLELIDDASDVVCFLDDDTKLTDNYFEELIKTYVDYSDITGVGGLAINENRWETKIDGKKYSKLKYYEIDGYIIKESQRNIVRKLLGLQSNRPPMVMPDFSNGLSYGYPFNSKVYDVDLLIGMSFSFRRIVFEAIKFSTFFEGYGLYEDADYCLRALKFGKNVINTNVQLYHYHDGSGRPNQYSYGKMVVRNGWYVWRVKYANPTFKASFKWHATAFLLTCIRFTNVITTNERKEALTESIGRTIGWFSLIFNKPKEV
ncbi:glycosyltransferase family 2 protein [uncultured Lacinutrix sp.]|uniref:glycosyltransferase family 2 protein n=1 Tax=uncultured Lacinutrix sp. TaxID=574032 RepID=UPI00260451CC|nr:glycosyltransferase family 2 protein [uncultured Lacinutrix sp.]